MRPGKPLMYGHISVNGKIVHIIGLPGNPVSSLVCSLVFLRPLVAKLAGTNFDADIRPAKLGTVLPANDYRRDYIRATVESTPDGTLIAKPFPVQDRLCFRHSSAQKRFSSETRTLPQPLSAMIVVSLCSRFSMLSAITKA